MVQPILGGIIILLINYLTGCKHTTDANLLNYIKTIKARPGAMKNDTGLNWKLPKLKKNNAYLSLSLNKRNPFNFYTSNRNTAKNPMQTAEKSTVINARFVGTMQKHKCIWALIEYPTGEISHAQVGDYIASLNGRIININFSMLTIKQVSIIEGKKKAEIKKLSLNHYFATNT